MRFYVERAFSEQSRAGKFLLSEALPIRISLSGLTQVAHHTSDTDILLRLWGKTNERERGYQGGDWESHPVICHMIDVGHVAEVWLEADPLIMDRFCILAPEIGRDELKRIVVTITALHDLGKVHRRFQSKSENGWAAGYGAAGSQRVTDYSGFDHGLGTAHIVSIFMDRHLHLRKWKSWCSAFHVVAAHHGRLYTENDLVAPPATYGLSDVDRRCALAAVDLISEVFELPEPLPRAPGSRAFDMLLAGFVSVSDWFGSNSEVFSFARLAARDDAHDYLRRLRSGTRAEDQLRDAGMIGAYREGHPGYADIFPFLDAESKLRPLQRNARTLSFGVAPGPEMAIVEAPMGMGKTEIALYLAAQAIASGNACGLYFALPTQASSNALFDRIYSFADRIRREDSPLSLAVAHGARRYFGKYQTLRQKTWRDSQAAKNRLIKQFEKSRADRGDYRDSEAAPSEIIAPDWLQSSKRTLLASIGLGTIDQAMLGAITVKHAFVRLFALSGKVVVFDEIHAYDSYMNVVIESLLRWLYVLGAKVVLLSATLPHGLRQSLLSTFRADPVSQPADPDSSAGGEPYPQILHLTTTLSRVAPDPPTDESDDRPQSVSVTLHRLENGNRTRQGVQLVLDLAADGGCIAWIRNTVREAQEAWRELEVRIDELGPEGRPKIVLLHARFTRHDRSRIEQELVEILGKDAGAERPQRMIIVATQVIEQSLDIDFDAMISDLAPIDLLLQRSGRLWRHARPVEQRHRHRSPVLHVLAPDTNEAQAMAFGSSAYVYEGEVLARTLRIVQDDAVWDMPASCRRLVSALYDQPVARWSADFLGVAPEKLEHSRKRQKELLGVMEGTARRILMPKPSARSLTMENAYSDDDRGDSVALTTRHGGASATIVLLERRNGALCCADSGDPLPIPLPDAGNIGESLQLDESILLSTVSFPWYKQLSTPGAGDDDIEALVAWWRKRHPYDSKMFVLLDEEDHFEHPQFTGRYRRDASRNAIEGLVIERKRDPQPSDTISYEDL